MSGKLDQSLDEILSTRRNTARGRPVRRTTRTRAVTAPVGGVQKNTKTVAKTTTKGNAAAGGLDSKIIVSNLPADVDEGMIKSYFGKTVGAVKKATVTYGPQGQSRGIATVIFQKPGIANEAAKKLNGLLVDGRPMKVEVVVDASRAAAAAPAKGMSDRVTKAKAPQAKQVKADSATTRGTGTARGARSGGRGRGRGKGAGRPSRKTAEELDAEMTDYFGNGTAAAPDGAAPATNGASAPAAAAAGGDDLGMDEIS